MMYDAVHQQKGFGEEVGWVEVEEGADVWEDKHLLGDAISDPGANPSEDP